MNVMALILAEIIKLICFARLLEGEDLDNPFIILGILAMFIVQAMAISGAL